MAAIPTFISTSNGWLRILNVFHDVSHHFVVTSNEFSFIINPVNDVLFKVTDKWNIITVFITELIKPY